ncbi:Hypothetical protein PAS_chr1-1_0342 [Komagataella phaffii GS115]|uniref:Secreted protein n=1 Tax=Komagataella phaffii (strain GS115 / ATCC 20864) TaxID=644223 RepID=C4QWU7_KOMPG|nr:Hypothetical protein PAS_chr1-1_0342 [Komagataella phaffii GS115]CAY67720.1 Hypothetical protein PAS_chr1-1_0342 [Komagataella phaffii GS115]
MCGVSHFFFALVLFLTFSSSVMSGSDFSIYCHLLNPLPYQLIPLPFTENFFAMALRFGGRLSKMG